MRVLLRGLIAILTSLFVSCAARGDVQALYWQIDSRNEIEFDYAVLYAVDTTAGEGATPIALPNNGEGGFAYMSQNGGLSTAVLDTELESLLALGEKNPSAYSFYIELVQWDAVNEVGIVRGVSEVASYVNLTQNNHILGGGLTIPGNLVVWKPATAVPEPTGGSLLLVGLAMLALRRSRRVS